MNGRCTLGRCERICSSADFRRVVTEGRAFRNRMFVLGVAASTRKHHRLGLSVSAKRVKQATARTRIRRLIKESFRQIRPAIKGGACDIVLTYRGTGNARTNFDNIDKNIRHVLMRAGLL